MSTLSADTFDLDFGWSSMSQSVEKNTREKKTYEADNRFWKISKNEAGKGVAIIRLLPDLNKKPWVRIYNYSLKRPNPAKPGSYLWYIANSPSSVDLPDPVAEKYGELKRINTVESEQKAKLLRRNTKFYTNILVVKDPTNPENEGKVFLWEFGIKMRDKITAWQSPSEDELKMGTKPKELYHPVKGHNIKLVIAPQGEFSTYDASEVIPEQSCILDTCEPSTIIDFIKTKTYDLNEFMSPEYYEPYETLKTRFDRFFGETSSAPKEYSPSAQASVPKAMPSVTEEEDDPFADIGNDSPAPMVTPKASLASDEDMSWLDDIA